jgi:hypothetical protein
MLSIPPNVAAIIIVGLEREITRQDAIGAVCGDNWPDDYEPNDVAIYRGFRAWLLENIGHDAVLEISARSKPTRFVMGLIPYFVRERFDELSAADVDAAFRTYSEYAALFCCDVLQDDQALHSSMRKWALSCLSKVLDFPKKREGDQAVSGPNSSSSGRE